MFGIMISHQYSYFKLSKKIIISIGHFLHVGYVKVYCILMLEITYIIFDAI